MPDLLPPGHQGALFVLPGDTERYAVLDPAGTTRVTTTALGVAFAAARQIVIDAGAAWIAANDGALAHLHDGEVSTATPRPWIDTISHAYKEAHQS